MPPRALSSVILPACSVVVSYTDLQAVAGFRLLQAYV